MQVVMTHRLETFSELTYSSNAFKVGIVSADGRKWTEEQIPKVKQTIKDVFMKHMELPVPESVDAWQDITLVSGHCPVGEEKYYCVTCGRWLKGVQDSVAFAHESEGHKTVKVYDQGGVDTWAEIIATELEIQKEIYPAPAKRWDDKIIEVCRKCESQEIDKVFDGVTGECLWNCYNCDSHGSYSSIVKGIKLKGFRSRNIQIAEAFDVGYCIVPLKVGAYCMYHRIYNHPSSGGCWTILYAQNKLGKEVHLIVVEQD